jgi:serine/threonine protein kinase
MEFIPGGTVEGLLKTYGPFDELLLKKFTFQIVKGVYYVHSNNVVHRLVVCLVLLMILFKFFINFKEI